MASSPPNSSTSWSIASLMRYGSSICSRRPAPPLAITRWYRIFPSLLSDASSSLRGMLPPQIATTPLDDALHEWVRSGFGSEI